MNVFVHQLLTIISLEITLQNFLCLIKSKFSQSVTQSLISHGCNHVCIVLIYLSWIIINNMRYFSFVNCFAPIDSLSLFQLKNLDVYVWYFLSGTWHTPDWISSRKLQSPEISLFLDKVFMCINKCNCSTFLITFFLALFFVAILT